MSKATNFEAMRVEFETRFGGLVGAIWTGDGYVATSFGHETMVKAHNHRWEGWKAARSAVPEAEAKPMFNDLAVYAETGKRAGIASRQRDTSRVDFHGRWLRDSLALEAPENRAAARKAYEDSYRAEATPSVRLG